MRLIDRKSAEKALNRQEKRRKSAQSTRKAQKKRFIDRKI
jgi:hypothetical protein